MFWAVKTAMTVAGSYDYTPTFMMIICGVLLIIWNALAQFVFVRGKRKKEKSSGIQRFCWCGCCVYCLLL